MPDYMITVFREEEGKAPVMTARVPMVAQDDDDDEETTGRVAAEAAFHVWCFYLGTRRVTVTDAREFGEVVVNRAPSPFSIIAREGGSFLIPA